MRRHTIKNTLNLINKKLISPLCSYWKRGLWQKLLIIVVSISLFITGSLYGIGQWYIWSNRNKPLKLGVTFIPSYARHLGSDPKASLKAIFEDLGVKNVRLVSYWDEIQFETPDRYDFSELDWQFEMANANNAKVSLAIGLRQPRWPECHMPKWAEPLPKSEWQPKLYSFMTEVVNRYKTNPALESYQLENEFFLSVFGICPDFDRNRLIEEYNLVKLLDNKHPVIVSRSNNWIGVPIGAPTPDEYGVSVYKRIWDDILTNRYLEYPYPAWYYSFYAGASKLLQGKEMTIHELQAEPWLPPGYNIKDAPVSEMYKSLNPERLKGRFDYGRATGIKEIYLWGAEWWYQMKNSRNMPEIWDTAKAEFARDKR